MSVFLAHKLGLYEDSKGKTRFVNVTLLSCPPVGRGVFKPRSKSRILSCCDVTAPSDVIYNHFEIGHGLVDRTKCFVCRRRISGSTHTACVDPHPERVDPTFVDKMRLFNCSSTAYTTRVYRSERWRLQRAGRDFHRCLTWHQNWTLKNAARDSGCYEYAEEKGDGWSACLTTLSIEYRLRSPSTVTSLGTPWHESPSSIAAPSPIHMDTPQTATIKYTRSQSPARTPTTVVSESTAETTKDVVSQSRQVFRRWSQRQPNRTNETFRNRTTTTSVSRFHTRNRPQHPLQCTYESTGVAMAAEEKMAVVTSPSRAT